MYPECHPSGVVDVEESWPPRVAPGVNAVTAPPGLCNSSLTLTIIDLSSYGSAVVLRRLESLRHFGWLRFKFLRVSDPQFKHASSEDDEVARRGLGLRVGDTQELQSHAN